MPRLLMRRTATAFGALTAACALAAGLTTATAAADEPPGLINASDIQVSVAYDQTSYDADANLTVTLTVENNSDETALAVTASESACVGSSNGEPWPGLGDPNGVTIAPHSSQTATLSGVVPPYRVVNGVLTCSGSVRGYNIMSNGISYAGTTTITDVYGAYDGVVYVDRNKDGAFETGEGISGITASYSRIGASDPKSIPLTTGQDGQFSLTHVLIGNYSIKFSSPSNWVVGGPGVSGNYTTVPVTRAATATGYFPAKRPLSDSLHATIGFDQPTYKPGDTVHLTVDLRNSSSTPISGVIADCNRIGNDNSLNSGAGWGELDSTGTGATIPPRQTRTFHVALPLPARAQATGYVSALCEFGPEPDQLPEIGFPGDPAFAKVPGLTAAFLGKVAQPDNTPVTATKVCVLDYGTRHAIATAVTDGQGEFTFAALPAGQYTLDIAGAWDFVYGDYFQAVNPGSTQYPYNFTVKPRTPSRG